MARGIRASDAFDSSHLRAGQESSVAHGTAHYDFLAVCARWTSVVDILGTVKRAAIF